VAKGWAKELKVDFEEAARRVGDRPNAKSWAYAMELYTETSRANADCGDTRQYCGKSGYELSEATETPLLNMYQRFDCYGREDYGREKT